MWIKVVKVCHIIKAVFVETEEKEKKIWVNAGEVIIKLLIMSEISHNVDEVSDN